MSQQKIIPERSAIPQPDTWNTADLYPSDQAWQEDFVRLQGLTTRLAEYEGRLGGSAAVLYGFLTLEQEAGELLVRLMDYAQRRSDEDTRVPEYQAMVGRITTQYVELSRSTAFEVPELLRLSDQTLEEFYQQEPRLELFRRYLYNIQRRRAHTLSDCEERLLAAAGELAQSPDDIFSKLSDADLTFPDAVDGQGGRHPLSNGSFTLLMSSEDRALRRSAFQNLYAVYGGVKNTLAATLNAQVKQLQFFSSARRYPSALAASLDGTHVPVEVYHNLISTVRANLDKMHRYVRLRKKLLGLEELHFYDVYAPMVSGVDARIPYADARETVYQAMAPLGADYQAILREGLDSRWIDVYENVGKRSGGYMAGSLVHPYILLNYQDDLDSMFTLAHELGHAVHSYLSNKTQPTVYRDYVIFVAEVASTCNEALLMEHLLQSTQDRRRRAWLLNHFLEQFKGTLYRQTMFAEFELRIGQLAAQGETLTADLLSREYRALNEDYFGPDMVIDDEIALEWARIPHFYYNYYVFQYATGYSAAIALSRRILKEGAPAVKDYLGFLSGGCSQDPIDLLRGAGVDMASPQPIQAALDLLGVPYTGSNCLSSAIAMDKDMTKRLVADQVRTPRWQTVTVTADNLDVLTEETALPAVVKPIASGSSIGVTIAHTREELRRGLEESVRLGGRTVLEQYIKGREIQVAVLNGRALPSIEIIPQADFYDYANKYQPGAAREVCPAEIPPEWEKAVGEAALAVFRTIGLSVYARADFIVTEDGTPYFLEINTLPGMTPTSLVPQEAAAVGIGYADLCQTIVEASLEARREGV